jgi:hypothetical protein
MTEHLAIRPISFRTISVFLANDFCKRFLANEMFGKRTPLEFEEFEREERESYLSRQPKCLPEKIDCRQ